MEVPREMVKLELQLPAYTIAHSNSGSLSHLVRPGIKPPSCWILIGFLTHWATTELLDHNFICQSSLKSGCLCGDSSAGYGDVCTLVTAMCYLSDRGGGSFCLFRAVPVAHGGSQPTGPIRAAATGHSHSNARSAPQLTYIMAQGKARSLIHWTRPRIEPATSWFLVGLFPLHHDGNSFKLLFKPGRHSLNSVCFSDGIYIKDCTE